MKEKVPSGGKSWGSFAPHGSDIKNTVRKGNRLSLRIGIEKSEIKMILK